MSTQSNFEKLMKLRDARNRAEERYNRAYDKYVKAVDTLGFCKCGPKLFQYEGKSYVVKPTRLYTSDVVSIEEIEV